MSGATLTTAPAPAADRMESRTLFGVIISHGQPRRRFYWIGLRRTEVGAICGATNALLVYGLPAVFNDVTDIFPLLGPMAPDTFRSRDVARWAIDAEQRGMTCLNDNDPQGCPIIDVPEEKRKPCF